MPSRQKKSRPLAKSLSSAPKTSPKKSAQEETMSPEEQDLYDWEKYARPQQKEPRGNWRTWLIMAGRGFGKTRTGAETIRKWVQEKTCKNIALIGDTERDVRQVMIEGPSGLLAISPDHERPRYLPSQGKLIWPCGAIATIYTSHAYEKLRGPQFDGAWIDELAKFRNAQETWDQLMFALRLGKNPRVIITTTPKPIPLMHHIKNDPDTFVTRGSTFDNEDHLSEAFIKSIRRHYEGTELGRQELYGILKEERAQTLWVPQIIAYKTYQEFPYEVPPLQTYRDWCRPSPLSPIPP